SNVGGSKFSLFSWELLRICMLNGVLSAIVVLGVLPVFEVVFRVLTNISLLELMDFNHPLLKRMLLEAPGTYQHSLVVANLGETAAESIGANALLVRVGAYYHDVGKIPKAQYFVENQIPYRDIHKSLKPSMSKLIIINHVKEGVELAKKYHLNPKIIDFIVQHHGRSLVYYFYQRAKELEPKSGCEEDYRYPGPRPQSKEVAIVSIADTIEALSRTLDEPTPSRIREMVKDVVRKKIMEGELDESDLTLKDLEKITESFIRMLNAIFHTRINYPQDNGDKESTKPQENKSK
ncbi:MAG: HDIG domain-containing protein, partial [Candidatus Omnitrophica bacterium]|nr:HDIG domain-containing protein [Candidatus Omnitrophota bacterium]